MHVVVSWWAHRESNDSSAQHQPVVPKGVELVDVEMPFGLQYLRSAVVFV